MLDGGCTNIKVAELTTVSGSFQHLYFDGPIPLPFVIWSTYTNKITYGKCPIIGKKCGHPFYIAGYDSNSTKNTFNFS